MSEIFQTRRSFDKLLLFCHRQETKETRVKVNRWNWKKNDGMYFFFLISITACKRPADNKYHTCLFWSECIEFSLSRGRPLSLYVTSCSEGVRSLNGLSPCVFNVINIFIRNLRVSLRDILTFKDIYQEITFHSSKMFKQDSILANGNITMTALIFLIFSLFYYKVYNIKKFNI